jgi:2-dehydropantoate 2-reductase
VTPFGPLPDAVSESRETSGHMNGRVWRREGNRAACLYVHGVESHSEWFRNPAGLLAAGGVDVWAFDRRGSGLSAGDRPFVGSFETFWDDYRTLALDLRREYDRLHLVAVSWGARLGVLLAGRDPDFFDTVSFLTPGFRLRVGYSLREKWRIHLASVRRPDRQFDLPIEPEMFTARAEALKYIRNDPLRTRRVPARFLRDMPVMERMVHKLAPAVSSPAAMYLAEDEAIISVRGARSVFKRLGSRSRRVRTFHSAKHALLFERPEEVARELADHFASAPRRKFSALVVGAGGVGGYLAASLARRGHRVTLLAREAQAAAITDRGLLVRQDGRESAVSDLEAVSSPPREAAFDAVIFAVKGFDTPAAAREVAGCVANETVVASFQNGLANEELLAEAFPGRRIAAGAVCAYLSSPEPGVVERLGSRGGVAVASYRGLSEEEIANWADLFRAAGLPAVTGTAGSIKWSKLLLNVSFNAISAATGLTVGEILSAPDLFSLGAAAFREALAAARAAGADPVGLPGYPVPLFSRVMCLPLWLARRLALMTIRGPEREGRSSMWQDISRGRGRTEIADLNGAVVEAAGKSGLPCPVNRYLTEVIERLAGDADARERYRGDPAVLAREAPGARGAAARQTPGGGGGGDGGGETGAVGDDGAEADS